MPVTLALLLLLGDKDAPAPLKTRPVCLWKKSSNVTGVTGARWTGRRFALAWGERRELAAPAAEPNWSPEPETPPMPHQQTITPPPPKTQQKPVTFEVKFGELEAQGELTGQPKRDVSPIDGNFSLNGKLAFNGAELGLLWTSGQNMPRRVYFRRLDKTGKSLSEPKALSGTSPYEGAAALAWNATTEQWGALWVGARSGELVKAHLYLSRFRSVDSLGEPVQLDVEAGAAAIDAYSSELWPHGACFVTAWADNSAANVMLGEACADGVRVRQVNAEKCHSPRNVTVGPTPRGFAVVWVDNPGSDVIETDLSVALAEPAPGGGWKVTSRKTLPAPSWAQLPAITFDGSLTWIAWGEQAGYPPTTEDVLVMTVGADGALAPPRAVPLHFAPPVFLTWAQGPKGSGLIVSSPNEPECMASFVPLP